MNGKELENLIIAERLERLRLELRIMDLERILRGGRISVRDAAGTPRITLGVDAKGRASIDVRDGSGRSRMALEVSAGGEPTLSMEAPAKGVAQLYIDDTSPEDKNRRRIWLITNSDASLYLMGTNGTERAQFRVSDSRGPVITMFDDLGTQRTAMGTACFAVADCLGRPTWTTPDPPEDFDAYTGVET